MFRTFFTSSLTLDPRLSVTSLKPTLARFLANPMIRIGVSWGSDTDLTAEKLIWQEEVILWASVFTGNNDPLTSKCRFKLRTSKRPLKEKRDQSLNDDKQNFKCWHKVSWKQEKRLKWKWNIGPYFTIRRPCNKQMEQQFIESVHSACRMELHAMSRTFRKYIKTQIHFDLKNIKQSLHLNLT